LDRNRNLITTDEQNLLGRTADWRGRTELRDASPEHWETLADLRSRLRTPTGATDASPVLALRLSIAPEPSVTSRCRTPTVDGTAS
jgi:hypothetical protein